MVNYYLKNRGIDNMFIKFFAFFVLHVFLWLSLCWICKVLNFDVALCMLVGYFYSFIYKKLESKLFNYE